MSTEKTASPEASHIENSQAGPPPLAPTVTISAAEYERLYLQPASGVRQAAQDFAKRLGNPTPIGLATFLLSLTPAAWILMQVNNATPTSLTVLVGPFYFLGGLGNLLTGILEWVGGNTFPSVVFVTFGGFWTSLGLLFDPEVNIPSAFVNGGSSAIDYNSGLVFYFMFWSALCGIYFIASLRTNLCLAVIFFTLIFTFAFLSVGYDRFVDGNISRGLTYFKVAGAFAFGTCISGWYLVTALLFLAVDMPFSLPVGDLSTRLLKKKKYQ